MRRASTNIIVILSLLIWSGTAHASSPAQKLKRGLVNIVTAPFEIPRQARQYWIEGAQQTDHIIVWVISGAVYGVVQDFKRFGAGVWDVVTFPIEQPADYRPLVAPEYVFEDWPSDESVFIFKRDRVQ